MKKPLFALLILVTTFAVFPLQVSRADDGSTNLSAAPADGSSDGSNTNGQMKHEGVWREAFAKLDLSDAQKEQIKQIRANTSPGKERRQQIMAVLKPEQKEKLKDLIQQYRSEHGDGETADTPNAN